MDEMELTLLEDTFDETWSLSDKDIDEILGIEHGGEDLNASMIDEAVDAFIDSNGQVPEKRKNLFKELFKREIKKKKLPKDEETGAEDDFNLSVLLYTYDTDPIEFNTVISGMFEDAVLSEDLEHKVVGDLCALRYEEYEVYKETLTRELSAVSHLEGYEELSGSLMERLYAAASAADQSADYLQEEYGYSVSMIYDLHSAATDTVNEYLGRENTDLDRLIQGADSIMQECVGTAVTEVEQSYNFIHPHALTIHAGMFDLSDLHREMAVENTRENTYGFPVAGDKFHEITSGESIFSSTAEQGVNNSFLYREDSFTNNYHTADDGIAYGPSFADMDDERYREYGVNPELVNGVYAPVATGAIDSYRQDMLSLTDEIRVCKKQIGELSEEYEAIKDETALEMRAKKDELAETIDEARERLNTLQAHFHEREQETNDALKKETSHLEDVNARIRTQAASETDEALLIEKKNAESRCQELSAKQSIDEALKTDAGFYHQKMLGEANMVMRRNNEHVQHGTESTPDGLHTGDKSREEGRAIDTKVFAPFYAIKPVDDFFEGVGELSKDIVPLSRIEGSAVDGYRELKNTYTFQTALSFLSLMGYASDYSILKEHNRKCGMAFEAFRMLGLDPSQAQGVTGAVSVNVKRAEADALLSKIRERDTEGRFFDLKRSDIIRAKDAFLERKAVADQILGADQKGFLSKAEIDFLNSKAFYLNSGGTDFARILNKYMKNAGSVLSNKRDLTRYSSRDLGRMANNPEKYGYSRMEGSLIKNLAQRRHKESIKNARNNLSRGILRRSGSVLANRIASMDEGMAKLLNKIQISMNHYRVIARLATVSAGVIRVYMPNTKIAGVLKKRDLRIAAKKEARALKKKELLNKAKQPAVKAGNAAKNTMAKVSRKWQHSESGKKAISRMHRLTNTRFVKAAKKAGKAARRGTRAVRSTAGTVTRIMKLPFQALGKFFAFFNHAKTVIIRYLGMGIISFISWILYALGILAVLIMVCELASCSFSGATKQVSETILRSKEETIVGYAHYKDIEKDIKKLKALDKKIYEEAVSFGEGRPPAPYDQVYDGKTIREWGSPDKERGYFIHYFDATGREIPSATTNAKDIEALCMAMCGNVVEGRYNSAARGKREFDQLIEDMHELMICRDPATGKPFTYEPTEIYYCSEGCREYPTYVPYYCTRWSTYQEYYRMKSAGVHFYENLAPYTGSGCEYRDVWVDTSHYEWDEYWVDGYYDYYGNWVSGYYESYRYWVDEGHWEEEPYCPGHYNRVNCCYGHRDVDINIKMYDLRYVISHNIYPSDWQSKPYANLIREFVEAGAWRSEWYPKLANNLYYGDWYYLYGFDVEGGAGFSTASALTDAEIKEILDRYDGDISAAREEIIKFALSAVGKIGYQWGGKADGIGWSATFGSDTPDGKDRTNGLDCSGFVQWVFLSTLGVKLPGGTAGYSATADSIGYGELKIGDLGFADIPGAESNHIGIYAGKNEQGQDMWVHCAGSTGVTYGSANFKYFYNVLQ